MENTPAVRFWIPFESRYLEKGCKLKTKKKEQQTNKIRRIEEERKELKTVNATYGIITKCVLFLIVGIINYTKGDNVHVTDLT